MLELEAAPGEAWVAHRRWWNAAPEASGEKWVDFTPRPAGLETLVLVESARGDKQPAPPSAALRAAAEQRLALGGLVAAAPVEAAPEPPEPPEPTTPPRKPRPQPPSTPPKLAFSGHETLGELVTLLSRGSAQAQAKAAAQLAAQAAAGAGESERLVAAGALPPLVLLLRAGGEIQEHAAKALMTIADCQAHQQLLTAAGAVPAVVQLLAIGGDAVKGTAAGILGNLAIQNAANQRAIVAAGAIPPLVAALCTQGRRRRSRCASHCGTSRASTPRTKSRSPAPAPSRRWWRCCRRGRPACRRRRRAR